MTASEPVFDFGIVRQYSDGTESASWGFGSAKVAAAFVADHSGQSWYPRPVRAVKRVVGPMEELNEEDE